MPIRLVPDKNKRSNSGNRRQQRPTRRTTRRAGGGFTGGSGGGGLGSIVGMLLPMLMKKPKLLLIVAVVGVVLYLFAGKGCSGGAMNVPSDNGGGGISSLFSAGTDFNEEAYQSTEIYEPLVDNRKNPLPERVDLRKYCPDRLNQGKQGSCVAWASAYAARTILEAQRTGKNPNQVKFSPSFMYNQIKIDGSNCQGSYIKLAMDNMLNTGAVPFRDFPYTDESCAKQPSSALMRKAANYKTRGFQRLTNERMGKNYELLAMKQNLAAGSPVIIGMMVGGSFMQNMTGQKAWIPTQSDYAQRGFGGHAMCVVGYDDYLLEGGAFLIMNSWGNKWGDKGFAWVRYTDFREFNKEAYGLYPMGNRDAEAQTSFKGSFGLEDINGKRNIPLQKVRGNYFETAQDLRKSSAGKFDGTKFKLEFTNNIECYTYVFGDNIDKSIALFPYTKKHSPYCGITGTRLFPREESLQPDEVGNKDMFAIVVTKKPIDYVVLNDKINASRGATYQDRVEEGVRAMGENIVYNPNFRALGSTISFETEAQNDDAVVMFIGVNKK